MPLPNSMNTAKGRDFQEKAASILAQYYKVDFQTEYPIPIGNPPKSHKFDLVSTDLEFVGESKNYSWTETGNVPAAKIGYLKEAVSYLQNLPQDKKRFVVMPRAVRRKHKESLAEYFYRINSHILNGIFVVEIDVQTGSVREFGI